MIYVCANCGSEIENLRTKGDKVFDGFYCEKCAHENYKENMRRVKEFITPVLENLQKQ